MLFVTILSLSSNLFFKFFINEAYLKGLLVDYLIPKIYVFDCLLVLNLIIFLFSKKNFLNCKKNNLKLKKIDISIITFLIFILISQFNQINLNLLINSLRLILIIIFLIFIYLDKEKQIVVKRALLYSVLWQSFLAYYQFINQQSLATYRVFGEPDLQHFALISRGQFFQREMILPYGSTVHPNVLAGIIIIFTIIIIDKKQNQPILSYLLLFNALIIILLTQSLSALLTWCLFLLYLIFDNKKKQSQLKKITPFTWLSFINFFLAILFIFTPLIIKQLHLNLEKNYLSISRRETLNDAAWQMFRDYPISGIGFNNFVRRVENYSQDQEIVRFIQPVHHVGLLLLSEGGINLAYLLLFLAWKFKNQINWSKLLILTPIAALDHYLITQTLGLTALLLIITFTWRSRKR